jgi:hypothetical protein
MGLHYLLTFYLFTGVPGGVAFSQLSACGLTFRREVTPSRLCEPLVYVAVNTFTPYLSDKASRSSPPPPTRIDNLGTPIQLFSVVTPRCRKGDPGYSLL